MMGNKRMRPAVDSPLGEIGFLTVQKPAQQPCWVLRAPLGWGKVSRSLWPIGLGPFPSAGRNRQGVPIPPTSGNPVPSAPKFSPATSPRQLQAVGGTPPPGGWGHPWPQWLATCRSEPGWHVHSPKQTNREEHGKCNNVLTKWG